ncbi:hypothetical protein [Mesorhizobium sp. M1338]|uniref:hypothetical protein n=1 Tax=Mesorhizobium sp. M1338 TaxID=2957085 RepID=UPI0033393A3B
MSARSLEAGYPFEAYIEPPGAKDLVKKGPGGMTHRDAAPYCDIVITCLLLPNDVLETYLACGPHRPGCSRAAGGSTHRPPTIRTRQRSTSCNRQEGGFWLRCRGCIW